MKKDAILGLVLVIIGLLLLYLLRDVLIKLVIFVLGFLGVLVAFALIIAGFALIFWRRRTFRYRVVAHANKATEVIL